MHIKNKRILTLSLLTGLVGLLVISVTYAWFASYKYIGNMEFRILQIDSLVNMYVANDLNENGVPDLLSNENQNKYLNLKKNDPNNGNYLGYSNYYYKEKYNFSLIDSKYALSKDSSANTLQEITLDKMTPSKIYTIKFEVINYSTFENNLFFSFDSSNTLSLDFLKQFEVRFGNITVSNPNTDNESLSYNFTDWISFLNDDSTSYEGITINSANNPYLLPIYNKYEGENIKRNGRLDFWLQLRIKDSATIENTNTFTLPNFRMTFEIPNIN